LNQAANAAAAGLVRPSICFTVLTVQDPNELFDVVDANDQILRTELRYIVHREKLMHRAVHVFVFNGAGQLYLQRRSLSKDSAPGKWSSSCAGHLNSGEAYAAAASRELGEEIGLYQSEGLKPLFKVPPSKETGQEFVLVYHCVAEGPFTLDPDEVIAGRWIHPDALNVWITRRPQDFAGSFSYLWERYCRLAS